MSRMKDLDVKDTYGGADALWIRHVDCGFSKRLRTLHDTSLYQQAHTRVACL